MKRKIACKRLIVLILTLLTIFMLNSCGKKIEGVSFDDAIFTYDGIEKSIAVSGLPEGATVEYDKPLAYTNAGEYNVKATVKMEGFKNLVLKATLKIEPKEITVNVTDLGPYASCGDAPKIPYTVEGVLEGEETKILFSFGDCDFTKSGTYTVGLTSENPNYRVSDATSSAEITVNGKEHIVTFETGIPRTLNPVEVEHNEKLRKPVTLNNLGYEFVGWYFNGELWDFDKPVTEKMLLVARWKPIEYTLTYHLNGGTNHPDNPPTYNYEVGADIKVPTKDGCIFLGWYEDEEFTIPASSIKKGTSRKAMELYAKWSDKEYNTLKEFESLDSQHPSIAEESLPINGKFRYVFSASFKEFGDNGIIYIGRGKEIPGGSYLKITRNEIIVITNNASGQTEQSLNHNCKMSDYVVIEIIAEIGETTMSIQTENGKTSHSGIKWSGNNGQVFVSVENSEFEDVNFGLWSESFEHPVWIFGDENVTTHDSSSWTVKLSELGYGSFLSVGSEHLTATDCTEVFEKLLEKNTPKYVIWAFEKESGTAYESATAAFLSMCDSRKIIPVLTTRPGAENESVNAAVKSSGRLYIDFAKALSYEGMLSDGKYTDLGLTALATRVIIDFPEFITPNIPVIKAENDLLAGNNNTIQFEENTVKDGKYLVFNAKIGELSDDAVIRVGHGYLTSYGGWMEITKTTVAAYGYASFNNPPLSVRLKPTEHGLELKNFITVVIVRDDDGIGRTMLLLTDGGYYYYNNPKFGWSACNGCVFASVDGGTLTDAKLNWACKAYEKKLWSIGASYTSHGDPARWPYYMHTEGYNNLMMTGHGGMQSEKGLVQLKQALQHAVPEYILWSMGGNNPDNGMPNESYMDCLVEMLELCKEYDIVPMIVLYPNCPKNDHTYKNQAVINRTGILANYEYVVVDLARATDGHVKGSEWYSNMLYSDLVHPTNLGARNQYLILLHYALEIISGGNVEIYTDEKETLSKGETLTITSPDNVEKEMVFTFVANYYRSLDGVIEIGNGKNVEGGTWIEISLDKINVYNNVKGEAVLVKTVDNILKMEDIFMIKIHVKNGNANIAMAAAGEKEYDSKRTELFNFDVDWSYAGDIFAGADKEELSDASLKWFTK